METQDIRAGILNTPLKQENIPTPSLPAYDGQLALRDIPQDVMAALNDVREKFGPAIHNAAIVVRSLVNRETGESIFQETDRDAVAKLGTTTLMPLFETVMKFFGVGKDAMEDAKKN